MEEAEEVEEVEEVEVRGKGDAVRVTGEHLGLLSTVSCLPARHSNARTHTHTHTRTHARTHAHTSRLL